MVIDSYCPWCSCSQQFFPLMDRRREWDTSTFTCSFSCFYLYMQNYINKMSCLLESGTYVIWKSGAPKVFLPTGAWLSMHNLSKYLLNLNTKWLKRSCWHVDCYQQRIGPSYCIPFNPIVILLFSAWRCALFTCSWVHMKFLQLS